MLTLLILTIVCVIIFAVSFVSPLKGTRIQKKVIVLRERITKFLNNRTKILQWILHPPSWLSHKLIHKSAHGGKQTRRKAHRLKNKLIQK